MTTDRWPVDALPSANDAAERAFVTGLFELLADGHLKENHVSRVRREMLSDADCLRLYDAFAVLAEGDRAQLLDLPIVLRRQADGGPEDAARLIADFQAGIRTSGYHLRLDVYANEITEAHQRKSAAAAMAEHLDQIAKGDPVAAVSARLSTRLDEIQQTTPECRSRDLLSMLDHWSKSDAEPVVLTGFSPIDQRLGGLPIGLTAIGAKPSCGKSALATQLFLGALLKNPDATGVWFRGEMTDDLLSSRMLAAWSGLRGHEVPFVTAKDALRRSGTARKVAVDLGNVIGPRLRVVDPPLDEATLQTSLQKRPTIAVVDHLHLLHVPDVPDQRTRIERASQLLADLATKYELPIVVVSTMAQHTTKASGIGSLTKDAGQFDYDAHNYLTLWRDDDDDDATRPTLLSIKKARTGGEGDVPLWFSTTNLLFRPAALDHEQSQPSDDFAGFAGDYLA